MIFLFKKTSNFCNSGKVGVKMSKENQNLIEQSRESAGMNMSRKELAQIAFPEVEYTIEQLEQIYPPRQLRKDAVVTRVAPSPTGFMHIGGIYSALISERLAHQTGGIFFLRIEDTDKKRELPGARDLIIRSLWKYGIKCDEGPIINKRDQGRYGPYTQSQRVEIYQSVVKHLLEQGLAYICFATPDELEEITNKQKSAGIRPGYYGEWAVWRDRPIEEVVEMIKQGKPYVVRFRNLGNVEKRIRVKDLFKGILELPEHDQDIVILKSNGLPTYHLAHVVDDHYMRTTYVLRGDEWLSSLPLHIQLFNALGWELPIYGHFAPIIKMENRSKRKLSKRKDPEANIEFYDKSGYPREAVIEYLLNLANPNFEDWRAKNPGTSYQEYKLSLQEISSRAGALLDLNKLRGISKDVIAKMSPEEEYKRALEWAESNDESLAKLLRENREYSIRIFGIEKGGKNPRKDIATWADLRREIGYFFDEIFKIVPEELAMVLAKINRGDVLLAIEKMRDSYDQEMSREQWLKNLRNISESLGFAGSAKDYEKDPKKFKGHIGDIARIYRVLLVGRNQSPDLFEIMRILGKARVCKRLDQNLL